MLDTIDKCVDYSNKIVNDLLGLLKRNPFRIEGIFAKATCCLNL